MFTSRGNQAMRIRQMKACFPQKQTKSVPPSRMGLFMPERAACHPCPEEGSSPPPLPPHGLWWGVGSLQAVGKKWTFVWLRISVLRSTFKFSMVSTTRHFKIKHSIFSPKLCFLWASHLREGYQRPSVVQTRNLGIIFTSQPHLLHHLLSPRWLWDLSLPSPSSPFSPRPALWHQLLPAPSTLSFPSLPSTHQPQGFPKHTLGDANAQFLGFLLPRLVPSFLLVSNIFINLARIDLSALSWVCPCTRLPISFSTTPLTSTLLCLCSWHYVPY